jgi:hypothetical protein
LLSDPDSFTFGTKPREIIFFTILYGFSPGWRENLMFGVLYWFLIDPRICEVNNRSFLSVTGKYNDNTYVYMYIYIYIYIHTQTDVYIYLDI